MLTFSQVHEIAESQCAVLDEQIKELVRHSDDDKYAGLNRFVKYISVCSNTMCVHLPGKVFFFLNCFALYSTTAEWVFGIGQTSQF